MTGREHRGGATHYEVLGVRRTADEATLRQAYVGLARRHHPDVAGGDAARMRAINAAWATLSDPARRARYDLSLREPPAGPAPSADDLDGARPFRDELADLDDRPLHPSVRMPRWLSLLPAGLFAGSLGAFGVGVVVASEPLIGLGLALLALSCLFFLAAPFIALYGSRRSND